MFTYKILIKSKSAQSITSKSTPNSIRNLLNHELLEENLNDPTLYIL